jgi:hypothetical protein
MMWRICLHGTGTRRVVAQASLWVRCIIGSELPHLQPESGWVHRLPRDRKSVVMCTWAHLARAQAGKAPYGCVGMSQAAKKAAETAAEEVRATPVCSAKRM